MKKLLVIFIYSTITNIYADNSVLRIESENNVESYCKTHGGTVIKLTPEYHTLQNKYQYGHSKLFCKIPFGGENRQLVDLETFNTAEPTLAVTYLKNITKEDIKQLMKGDYPNPANNVCKNLHGSSIIFTQIMDGGFVEKPNGGQAGICVFGDGSSISSWALYYTGAAPDEYSDKLKKSLRGEPLNISIDY